MIKIKMYDTTYRVASTDIRVLRILGEFNLYLTRTTTVGNEVDKEYYFYNVRTKEYYYSINTIRALMSRLGGGGFVRDDIELIYRVPHVINGPIDLAVNPKYSDRDYQKNYIRDVVEAKDTKYQLIHLRTGMGKTYITARCITELDESICMLLLPKYMEKWETDLKELTNLKDYEYITITGKKQLRDAMECEAKYKIVILSLNTVMASVSNWIKDGCPSESNPETILKKLGCGMIINDESHQSFHALHQMYLHLAPRRVLGMTATKNSLDSDHNKWFSLLYPRSSVISGYCGFKPYINTYVVNYTIARHHRLKCTVGGMYNHAIYEGSIMSKHRALLGYFDMIYLYLKKSYVDNLVKDNQALIYFATRRMCKMYVRYLEGKLPKLDIRTYIGKDPYDNLIKSDIRVATNGMCGAAADIPKLTVTIQTVSIRSQQANEQSHGRLREVENVDLRYYCLVNTNMREHVRLNGDRMKIIRPLSKRVYTLTNTNTIG